MSKKKITYKEIIPRMLKIEEVLFAQQISWGVKKLLLKIVEKIA